eukprot:Skav207935  [mRNA]  locus=scaffold108:23565:24734:+ [translate_table: standard]
MGVKMPTPYARLVLDRLFSAVLNYVDFVTDILVMLEYGCFLRNALSTRCAVAVDNLSMESWIPVCQPHWWWFGLSLSILVVSTVAQAFVYTIRPGQHGGFCCFCCLGIFQLTYLRDLGMAICFPDAAQKEAEINSSLSRDLMVKISECTPQLYLQTYILFAIQAQGDQLKVISTLVSAASLALGLVKFMAAQSGFQGILETFPRKLAVGLFLTTDQLLRAWAYAVMLSEAAWPVGVPIMLLFPLVSLILCYKALGTSGFGGLCLALSAGVWAGHILPLLSLTSTLTPDPKDFRGAEVWKRAYIRLALPLRYLEMTSCGVVGFTVAKTACGQVPVIEMTTFFILMFGNLIVCIGIILCTRSQVQVNPSEESHPESPPLTLVGANCNGTPE